MNQLKSFRGHFIDQHISRTKNFVFVCEKHLEYSYFIIDDIKIGYKPQLRTQESVVVYLCLLFFVPLIRRLDCGIRVPEGCFDLVLIQTELCSIQMEQALNPFSFILYVQCTWTGQFFASICPSSSFFETVFQESFPFRADQGLVLRIPGLNLQGCQCLSWWLENMLWALWLQIPLGQS